MGIVTYGEQHCLDNGRVRPDGCVTGAAPDPKCLVDTRYTVDWHPGGLRNCRREQINGNALRNGSQRHDRAMGAGGAEGECDP